jgi:hypothetical protein
MVECLPNKCETLSSNPSAAKKTNYILEDKDLYSPERLRISLPF